MEQTMKQICRNTDQENVLKSVLRIHKLTSVITSFKTKKTQGPKSNMADPETYRSTST
jgi:hypothetical protein